MDGLAPPSFDDLLAARERIAPYLSPTPLHRHAALDELLGAAVYVKHENHQPVGAFKVRGGLNLMAQLSPAEREAGVVTASTGNHGLSIAFAARRLGVAATICVPCGANPGKVNAIRALGARTVEEGVKFEGAFAAAERLARERGMRFIHSANEPQLIAGVGTLALEVFTEQPDLDYLLTAVGLGSGASGACLAARELSPRTRVIGVQAAASPAVHDAWRSGRLESRPNETFAEGLATGRPAELTLAILREQLAEFRLVSEAEILRAIVWWIERAHTLAESAAAATLAGAYGMRDRLAGCHIGLVCTGGNLALDQLRRALGEAGEPSSGSPGLAD
ncbi:MAG: threonine/serine dehydratase [Verrucomicrobia bacterium]|nr:threonine/serine dehydratase [Verrucomicrobiota bacterium]